MLYTGQSMHVRQEIGMPFPHACWSQLGSSLYLESGLLCSTQINLEKWSWAFLSAIQHSHHNKLEQVGPKLLPTSQSSLKASNAEANMKTAAETEAALTGTFLNRSFRVVFLCHLGKVEECLKFFFKKKQNIRAKMILPQLSVGAPC